jgi:hypothetical protein
MKLLVSKSNCLHEREPPHASNAHPPEEIPAQQPEGPVLEAFCTCHAPELCSIRIEESPILLLYTTRPSSPLSGVGE